MTEFADRLVRQSQQAWQAQIANAEQVRAVPPNAHRIRDAEGGIWRRMGDSDYFMPEFAGGNLTLAEIIDHFGPVTVLDDEKE